MRYKFFSAILVLVSVILSSCNSNGFFGKAEEMDSLRTETKKQQEEIKMYKESIILFSSTLDSISLQEDMLFTSNGENPVTKEDVKYNLNRFSTLLKKQSDKIKMLEKELSTQKDSTKQTFHLIEHLKNQIELKNHKIALLQEEINKKNVGIVELQTLLESQKMQIATQTETINELNIRNKRQNEALSIQDAMLNNGYVLIGSKSDLKRKGIIKRGKIVADAALDRSKFFKVDIREWKEVTFTAKKPKILSNMPSKSYEITTSGNRTFTLKILNPTDFWKLTSYLIIQTN